MPTSERETRLAALAGTLASLAMIAYQMAGKATRDAVFLSNHPATALPAMLIAAAVASLLIALGAGKLAHRVDPGRVVPIGFGVSAALTLVEWGLIRAWPGPAAVFIYLHFTGLGALLVSGFWSVVNERFDPRSAKRIVSRIAAGGTAGGLLGGILAERAAAWFTVEAMFPVLAACHVAAGVLTLRVAAGRSAPPPPSEVDSRASGISLLTRSSYLRWLTVMVLCAGVAEGLLDLAFKTVAAGSFGGGEPLLRFFAAFYTTVGLATVVIQTALTRRVVQRYGVTGTAAILPGTVAVGAAGFLVIPGMGPLTALRGLESLFHNSLYRSAYELLFNPLAPRDKRAIKPLLDVGVARIGDSVAGALMQVIIWLSAATAAAAITTPAIAATMVLAVLAALAARRLHLGYRESLEHSLLARGRHLDDPFDDPSQTAILQTMGAIDITQFSRRPSAALDPPESALGGGLVRDLPLAVPARLDPELARILELQSRDEARVRAALADGPFPRQLVPFAIPLLAWDAVARDAIRALRPLAPKITGLLVDHLLDPDSDFSVRRRLPLVLVESPTPRAFDGLLRGLEDRRFEVRYRCGRVLARLHEQHPTLAVDRGRVVAAVEREVAVDRGVWQSHRLLDAMDDDDWSPMLDEVVRDRANRSLEHVFTMLSLILPAQALRVAYRGLHTEDAMLRGTALEYLETALPDRIRQKLWPFLEASHRTTAARNTDDVLQDLLKSQESIAHRLEVLKRLREEGSPPDRGTAG